MKKILKKLVNTIRSTYRSAKIYYQWKRAGMPNPPPHSVKQKIIKEYARRYNIRVFVETGTYLGEMVEAVRKIFGKIYSIELSEELHNNAIKKFAKHRNITLSLGDSASVLPLILDKIREQALFWLDGHYSAGNTALGNKETPIVEELHHIFKHGIKNHIILIDDARCFIGKKDYPTIEQLSSIVKDTSSTDYAIEIENDVIRIVPK